ncbi:MAG: helix-hairpin-helix domain-containing protein [Oscillospiraceae bacterium]|nr:helix-hairpin-helix domain-containing protein [Oscillospiraceae bacterium]
MPMKKQTALFLSLALTALYLLWLLFAALRFMPEEGVRVHTHEVPESLLLEGHNARRTLPPGETVDLNTADTERLKLLPGIGSSLAGAIVSYRAQHGPFGQPEELMRVPGIGEKKFEALQGLITVSGNAPGSG